MAKKTEDVRNYLVQPRREGEFDSANRGDLEKFEETLTVQSEAPACDINNILARYERTGQLPDMIRENAQYGDFSDVGSFMEAQNIVAHANAQFAALDAHVRARFLNSPAEMLKFIDEAEHDHKKAQELVQLGLAVEHSKEAQQPDSDASKQP